MSSLAELRVFRSTMLEDWAATPVSAYLPVLVAGDLMADNIKRRLKVGFFKQDPTITLIRWNLKGHPEEGHWIKREDL